MPNTSKLTIKSGFVLFVTWTILTLSLGISTLAQNATGRIVGSVTDPQGAVLAEATVAVINTATGIGNKTVTNSEGYFEVLALPIGTYKVTVEHPGFSAPPHVPIWMTQLAER